MTPTRRPPARADVGHSHRLPGWLFAGLAIIVLGLVGSLVLVSYQSIATNNRLTAVEQYIAGKGAQRDAENAAQNQRIDDAVCSVLDELPAGGRLDPVRALYRCGPGQPAAPAAVSVAPGAAASATPAPPGARPAPVTANRAAPRTPHGTPTAVPAPPSTADATPAAPPAGPVTAILCALDRQLCPSP